MIRVRIQQAFLIAAILLMWLPAVLIGFCIRLLIYGCHLEQKD